MNSAILEEQCCFLLVLPTRRKVEVLNLFMTIKYKERINIAVIFPCFFSTIFLDNLNNKILVCVLRLHQ